MYFNILINLKQITLCNFALQMGNENLLSVAMACSDLLDKEIQQAVYNDYHFALLYCITYPIHCINNKK